MSQTSDQAYSLYASYSQIIENHGIEYVPLTKEEFFLLSFAGQKRAVAGVRDIVRSPLQRTGVFSSDFSALSYSLELY